MAVKQYMFFVASQLLFYTKGHNKEGYANIKQGIAWRQSSGYRIITQILKVKNNTSKKPKNNIHTIIQNMS